MKSLLISAASSILGNGLICAKKPDWRLWLFATETSEVLNAVCKHAMYYKKGWVSIASVCHYYILCVCSQWSHIPSTHTPTHRIMIQQLQHSQAAPRQLEHQAMWSVKPTIHLHTLVSIPLCINTYSSSKEEMLPSASIKTV